MNKSVVGLTAGLLMLALQVAGRGGDPDHARDLVARAIKASGGEAKVAPLKAGTCKAKLDVQEGNQRIVATLDITWQGWDQYRFNGAVEAGGNTKNALIVINGDKGWIKDLDSNKVDEAPKDAVPLIVEVFAALRMPQMLSALLDKEIKLSPLGEVKIGERATLGVTVARKDRKDVRLFFDKETGLPAKSEVQVTDPRGMEKSFEFIYHDYKETGGLKQPMRIVIKTEEKAEIVLELSDLKAGKVEPGLFAAPE